MEADIAMETADLILLVVDAHDGLTPTPRGQRETLAGPSGARGARLRRHDGPLPVGRTRFAAGIDAVGSLVRRSRW